jgi:hypothetical protein
VNQKSTTAGGRTYELPSKSWYSWF